MNRTIYPFPFFLADNARRHRSLSYFYRKKGMYFPPYVHLCIKPIPKT